MNKYFDNIEWVELDQKYPAEISSSLTSSAS